VSRRPGSVGRSLAAAAAASAVWSSGFVGAALGPRYGGEARLALSELPPALAPVPALGPEGRAAIGLFHETLVDVGLDGALRPSLAEAWHPSAGAEWTLQLREGATFHDGTPVSADDAVRSLRRFLRAPGAAARAWARAVEGGEAFRAGTGVDPGIRAAEARHVVVRLLGPGEPPWGALASPAAAVVSASGSGSGPFAPAMFVPGTRLDLGAFSGHVRGRPYLDRVRVDLRPEPFPRAGPGAPSLSLHGAGPAAPAGLLVLALDPSRPPFDRLETRRAVSSAFDRSALTSRFLPGGTPWAGLLPATLEPSRAAAPGVAAPAPARGLLSGRLRLAVGRDVPPAAGQRVMAVLHSFGAGVEVEALAPSLAPEARAEARLLFWVPEVADAALALDELETLERDGTAPSPPGRPAEREARLRDRALVIGLARVPVAWAAPASLHGAAVDRSGRLRLEEAWAEP
jgi:ABC-type transport system substrate-binding protein